METKNDVIREWLRRAYGNLVRAQTGRITEDFFYEDLCFDAQQAVEKSLKSLLIHHDIEVKKTHSISYLLTLLEDAIGEIPENVCDAEILTEYAVTTRYPGDWAPVGENEYHNAIELAKKIYDWVLENLPEDMHP